MSQATVYTFDEDQFSDLHKDAYGFRPHSGFWEWLQTATDDQKQAEWDSLLKSLEATIARENEMEQEAIARFEAAVAATIAAGAGDRATAVKWLMDAEGDQYVADVNYFEWSQGIPYGYIGRTA